VKQGLVVALALVAVASQARAQERAHFVPGGRVIAVAPERFHPALARWASHKEKRLPVEVVSLEKILASSPGRDEPEKIKKFLYAAWRERGLSYVLLVGDADVLPVRYMVLDRCTTPAFDYAFYPSDLYYADLAKADGSFEDWNGRADGFHARYWGEVRGEKNKKDGINFDKIDYVPEVAVGRWPVSTVAEVETVAEKTIVYEEGQAIAPRARRAAFLCVDGWVDARGLLDSLAAILPAGWTATKRYYGSPTPPDEPSTVALLNEGAGLVIHAGHGGDDVWGGALSTASLARVKNRDRLPILVSAGCSTARFATLPPYEAYTDEDGVEHKGTNAGEVFQAPPPPPACYQRGPHNPTGLGEQLLRAGPDGAVAYYGCNTGSQPCGLTLVEGLIQGLSRSREPRLGDGWVNAVAHYWDAQHLATIVPDDGWYPASIFFQGMKYMLFGDPSIRMPLPLH
jgi:hypothetical protein